MPSYAPDGDGQMNTGATPERLNDKIVMRAERPRLERVPKSRRRPEFRRRPEPPAIGRPDTRVVRGAGAQGKCRTANVDIIDNNQAWFGYVKGSKREKDEHGECRVGSKRRLAFSFAKGCNRLCVSAVTDELYRAKNG